MHDEEIILGTALICTILAVVACFITWGITSTHEWHHGIRETLNTTMPCQEAGGGIVKISDAEYVCTDNGWHLIKRKGE